MEQNNNNNAENGKEIQFPKVPKEEIVPEMVQLPKAQLTELIDKLKTYENDLVTMVSVLLQFSGLFSGKSNMLSLVAQIPKLINDPQIIEQFKTLAPILEKYGKASENE
ncbi:hypothetical protein Pedsa_0885 [Pseudopedobacter saltans DSM 12145]|uniref:DUF1641 domain-containing protein n=1 Tax=Pseudopedobacter saltans (strain ATCC 51119 / DSM 12145 / JCM 21818 / CCUG 39354 / LMG 10337 / NBRC 100064 / NCIMB 13643) TaxID=762903 RepID=F0SA80_PSESL|nr:hypothetical protein [Pseudopedobacter saltans]ADY51457.1 hypothetical protein Pedsa_0885 [Pseudopedobacter saltans DSM 12145]